MNAIEFWQAKAGVNAPSAPWAVMIGLLTGDPIDLEANPKARVVTVRDEEGA
jgi:hypothetical protein